MSEERVLEKPVEVGNRLTYYFVDDQAMEIARSVYQPLYEKIKELEKQIKELKNQG